MALDTSSAAGRTDSALRRFLRALEEAGRLRRVTAPVDPRWEPAALAKWLFQAIPERDRFGLAFERVLGSEIPLVVGAFGSADAIALALGVDRDAVNERVRSALLAPVAPVCVEHGPVHDVVRTAANLDLGALPVPTWTPEKDAGPYVTAPVITKNAASGVQNVGIYRTQVLDGRRLAVNFSPGRQGTANAKTFHDAGAPAPVAWVIGAEPAVYLAAVGNVPYGAEELRFAGGLQQAPVELVPARTVDLLVPANAEIVIEGEVYPGELAEEGPFGEFAGFMSAPNPRPVVRVTAITHRREPIYWGLSSQMPPSESTALQSTINAAVLLKTLRDDLGESSVVDAYIDHTFGGLLGHGVFAVRQGPPGNAKRLGRLIASISYLKRITMVDADVDLRDPVHLEWALNSCFDPARDTVVIDDVFVPAGMDPSVPERSRGSKLVLDATQKLDAGSFSLPPEGVMTKALERWNALGLPPFSVPKRVRSRLARS